MKKLLLILLLAFSGALLADGGSTTLPDGTPVSGGPTGGEPPIIPPIPPIDPPPGGCSAAKSGGIYPNCFTWTPSDYPGIATAYHQQRNYFPMCMGTDPAEYLSCFDNPPDAIAGVVNTIVIVLDEPAGVDFWMETLLFSTGSATGHSYLGFKAVVSDEPFNKTALHADYDVCAAGAVSVRNLSNLKFGKIDDPSNPYANFACDVHGMDVVYINFWWDTVPCGTSPPLPCGMLIAKNSEKGAYYFPDPTTSGVLPHDY